MHFLQYKSIYWSKTIVFVPGARWLPKPGIWSGLDTAAASRFPKSLPIAPNMLGVDFSSKPPRIDIYISEGERIFFFITYALSEVGFF